MAGQEALKKLEEQLECSICLGTFTEPKLLNCNHFFCASCLPQLTTTDNSLTCPTCQKATAIPESGLGEAFQINRLLEIHQSLKSDLLLSANKTENVEESTSISSTTSLTPSLPEEIEVPPDPSKCFIIIKDLATLEVGKKGSVHVLTMDNNSELYEGDVQSFECEFVSEFTGKNSVVSVERQEKSLYELNFMPTVRGTHKLLIKINGKHIDGSPLSVAVRQSIETTGSSIGTLSGVGKPWGVAINQEGEIIVSEKGKHRISIFSPQGLLRSFGTKGSEEGQFKKPCGVAVDQNGNIFVADTKNHRIQKFTSDGKFLKAVGTKGSGDLQFEELRGMAFNTFNDRLYIIDKNRIQVLGTDLSFISSFGKFKEHTVFNMPVSIACDISGQLYVADCMNNRIVVLTPEGEFVKALGGMFHMLKQTFNHPVGVAVDNDGFVYLSQLRNARNHISVVTPEGELVKELVGGSGIEWGTIYTPIGLAVDTSGVLYVCELNSNRVAVY